jgi:hypothetical protein
VKIRGLNDDRIFKFARLNGKGRVAMRFLPDKKGIKFKKFLKIAKKNGDRLYAGWIADAEDKDRENNPFTKKFTRLFNAGDREEAKLYSSSFRYLAPVIILEDEVTPENNGKTFILDMGNSLYVELENHIKHSSVPEFKEWSFLDGSFIIETSMNANRWIKYEKLPYNGSIDVRKINLKFHDLSEGFLKSYEELQEDLEWYEQGDIARLEKLKQEKVEVEGCTA